MHDDLIEFIVQIKKMGFKVKLDSNGTRPDIIKTVLHEQLVDYIAMDIKAPLSKYSHTVARPVDADAIAQSIALLKEGNVAYEFRTTVVKSLLSPEDIEQIGKDIAGASQYFLQRFVSTKILNPAFVRKTTYSDQEFESFVEMLQPYVTHCSVR